jgi:hypothetical protein
MSGDLLERNLRLLALRSARAAEAVRAAPVPAELALTTGADGGLTGQLQGRQLASLRGPIAEGEKLAQSVDISTHATVVVRGFGVGHHVAALVKRLKGQGAVIVFEPDVGLLRGVLERVDCSWLAGGNVAVLTEAEDTGAIAAGLSGLEGILAAGTVLVDHPASRARLGAAAEVFGASFATVMKAVRTNVVTTLVQVDVTLRNLLLNLPWYATVPGVTDLQGSCQGKPAVVVAAGPSLRRNVDLLSRPGVRDRVVIIAVQTVLKTLLSKGIRPHFVTALDYHEISRRFYEGLTATDVEGVTLIAEPKCNRAILEAFPGAVRCVRDDVLDQVLGAGLARPMGDVQPGATVAHLAYYFARYLGCDPVILIGQDLGFTDGQYYAPGAAIHQVWSSELNEFNTLEMLEWQRIARMRNLLRRVRDQQRRTIYTDEQMATYLVQFERDFMHDAARGLTTIDATEGGVLKQHTRVMPLREALDGCAGEVVGVRATPAAIQGKDLDAHLAGVRERLGELRRSAARIALLGREAAGVLEEMLAHQQDQPRVNRLIERTSEMSRQAAAEPAYNLVQWVNQTGQLKRYRADRAIRIDPGLSPMERQQKEIERDTANVRWLADAADHVAGLLDEAAGALVRGPAARPGSDPRPRHAVGAAHKLWACVHLDPDVGGLGTPRKLARPWAQGLNPLQAMLARLARCERLAGVVLMTGEVERVRAMVGAPPAGLRVEYEAIDGAALRDRSRAVGVGRLWARHCWRGGLANLSCYDEALWPAGLAPVLAARGLEASVCVGADWAMVDPALVDAVIERHVEGQDLAFAHAPPGLGACAVARRIVEELAAAASPVASIGGLIGYLPRAPQADPIAKPACLSVDPCVRDLLVRCVPDSAERSRGLAGVLGDQALTAGAPDLARLLSALDSPSFGVEQVTVHVGGVRKMAMLSALRSAGSELVLNIVQGGAPLEAAISLAQAARECGFTAVHLRTPLLGGPEDADTILDAGIDLVSIDVLAETEATYRNLTGRAGFDRVRDGVTRLLERRSGVGGMPRPWVVPRITRRDAVYEEVEDFYIRGLLSAGACVIDPLPSPDGGRIEPLPLPPNAVERLRGSAWVVGVDGVVRNGAGEVVEGWNVPAHGRAGAGVGQHT